MKKIIILILLIPTLSWGEKLISLDDYYAKHANDSDPSVLSYLSSRCSSLYSTISVIVSPKDENLAAEMEQLGRDFFTYLLMSDFQLRGDEISMDELTELHTELVRNLNNKYVEIGNNEWENTGSYFSGFLKQDLDFCNQLNSELSAALSN